MISILHLSDLHIVQSGHWNNLRSCILKEARKLHDKSSEEKLLILTGDLRNNEDDYTKTEKFLGKLFEDMGIDPKEGGVFAVPGNHDVGNDTLMNQFFPNDNDWDMRRDDSIEWLKKHNNAEERYKRYLQWRMESYRPFCDLLSRLGVPLPDLSELDISSEVSAAAPHVRCWKNKLNIFHLNTTLVSVLNSEKKDNQQVDLLAATNDDLWKDVDDTLPAIALGHNSFFDLDISHQIELEAVFHRHHVCAYLCGDTHKEELDRYKKFIRLKYKNNPSVDIPNIVGVKGTADETDNFADFGLYLHEWDEVTDTVILRLLYWEPKVEQAEFFEKQEDPYNIPRQDGAKLSPHNEASSPSDLRETLDKLLDDVRTNHPSFKLMEPDDIDRHLCSNAQAPKQLPSMGSIENGEKKPVWTLIAESWELPENHSIVIEGAGGIGKTVTLLSPGLQGTKLPVPALYIPLYEMVDKEDKCLSIDDYLEKRHPTHKADILSLAGQPWQNGPKLLLLLDGFNEIPQKHRITVLSLLNDWRKTRTGVQLIAVSRPMDSLELSKELYGSPISLKLSPLDETTVKDYLIKHKMDAPPENSPIWKVLTHPLFLVLYTKTNVLKGRTAFGYPLSPKEAVSGGALIWNFLQRELLRIDQEDWVLPCAVACQYILPFVAYRMAEQQRITIERAELEEIVSSAASALKPEQLPSHLKELYDQYVFRHEEDPGFSEVKWLNLVLQHEGGQDFSVVKCINQVLQMDILVQRWEKGKRTYIFPHQHIRDALAGMYLVGQAESTPSGTLPEVWRTSHSPELMDYAAELMEEDTAQVLWSCVRALKPLDRRCLYVQLELHRSRGIDGFARLNFSDMDLRDISLAQYGNGLFQNPDHTIHTQLNLASFQEVGHNDSVKYVTVLEDGRLVSGSDDGTLRIWDPNTGDSLNLLEGHTGWISCVTMLKDGRIVSGSHDKTLRVWSLQTGECQVLKGHTNCVNCVTTLEDGRIVSGSDDKTLRVWNLQTGECQVLEGHTFWVTCMTTLKDGRIVSGSYDDTFLVWNLQTGKSQMLKGHTGRVSCVTELKDGRIVSGSDDNTLRVWNLQTGKSQMLKEHTGGVSCVTELMDDRIVSGSDDKTLRVWNLQTGKCQVLRGHNGRVRCVTELKDGRIVSGSDDKTLRVWNLETGECQVLEGHTNSVACVTVLKDGRIVSGAEDNSLLLWSPKHNAPHRQLGKQLPLVTSVSADPGGRWVTGHNGKTTRIWDGSRRKVFRILREHTSHVNCLIAQKDGTLVFAYYDNQTGEYRVPEGYSPLVSQNTVLEDGRIFIMPLENTLQVWNLQTRECRVLKGHNGRFRCVTELKDGRIVSGSDDNTLRVWNLQNGECQVLEGHTDVVSGVIPLDNQHVLSGSYDCTLRIWDVDSGKCISVIPISEMDVIGMDLRNADMDSETAWLLYCNGAKVPENLIPDDLVERL